MTVVDAHQHLWDLERGEYEWLSPEYGPLYRTFTPEELEPQLRRAGVDATVLVQAADTLDDTESMLAVADRFAWVAGVVGWLPLSDPGGRDAALERFTAHPAFRGVRHLIHEEPDTDWVLQDAVQAGLRALAARGLTFDVVAVLPRHLEHVPVLARAIPDLRIVVDHLAKPPIKDRGWQPWADLLAAAAEHPNVFAKLSGLNTAADPERWAGSPAVHRPRNRLLRRRPADVRRGLAGGHPGWRLPEGVGAHQPRARWPVRRRAGRRAGWHGRRLLRPPRPGRAGAMTTRPTFLAAHRQSPRRLPPIITEARRGTGRSVDSRALPLVPCDTRPRSND